MNNIIKRTWNKNSIVTIEDLRGMAFQAESGAHTFEISAVDGDGNPVALSGTPSGTMLRPDNTDQTLTCSVSDGKVYATLPAGCYDVPGRAGITVFLTSDSQKTAIYAAVVSVSRTQSGTAAPGTTASVVDLVNAIETAISQIPASDTNLKGALAATYSNSALYGVGSYAWYDGKLYKCTTAITTAETWNSAHWTEAKLANDVCDLKSAVSQNTSDIFGLEQTVAPYQSRRLNDSSLWENKLVATATGIEHDATTRILVKGYYNDLISATCDTGYKVKVFGYNSSKEYIGQWNDDSFSTSVDKAYESINLRDAYKIAAYLKILILKSNNTDIPVSDCSKCTIQGAESVLNNKVTELETDVSDIKDDIYILNVATKTSEERILNDQNDWERKFISTATGIEDVSTTRILCKGYFDNLISATCDTGYKVKVFGYGSSKTYLGQWNDSAFSTSVDKTYDSIDLMPLYDIAAFLKIIILKSNNAEITVSDYSKCTINGAVSPIRTIEPVVNELAEIIEPEEKRILNNTVNWEAKFIVTASGVESASTTRILSSGYYKHLISAVCDSGYKVKVFGYNASKEYIGQWNDSAFSTSVDKTYDSIDLKPLYDIAVYLRIIILKSNNTDIQVSDCSKCTITALMGETDETGNNFGVLYPKDKRSIEELGGAMDGNNAVFKKMIGKKLYVRGNYNFPKNVHSTNAEVDLLGVSKGNTSVKVSLLKATTGSLTSYPYDPVPKYNAGIKVYHNGTEAVTFIPDGWRKDFLLGQDAMTIRFKGDCSVSANQDIHIKIDSTNVDIYHSETSTLIHRFAKSSYSTMRALYEAIYTETQTGGDLTDFEVQWLNLNDKTPDDLIECDVNLVAQYYTDVEHEAMRYDAFPFYFTMKQEGKSYDIEILLDFNAAELKLQVLLNGCKIDSINKVYTTEDALFDTEDTITLYNLLNSDVVCNEAEISQNIMPKYPNIRPVFIEQCEDSIEASSDYPTSLNQVMWFATLMKEYERQYIQLESIEQVLDSGMKTNTNYLWQLQVDDGSPESATNKKIREAFINNNIRPSIAVMLNETITQDQLKWFKATERAGYEYHIHSTKTDGEIHMEYYSYAEMVANVDEAITEFVNLFGELPIVWGMHAGNLWYRISKFLRSRGFRMIFGGVDLDASLNEITRYGCKRAALRDTGGESSYLTFNKSY